ncbi:hypothetical protein BDP81DRAFT_455656 [Colletotrichum phormii]|uniref:Uncharacterized protein n=1 Tax=Colletotrichum phormii TaxID=359342 RepID=A0AAJ0E800_9PEZI|nr:uncharacterized protein BDP81DRAFT_455656 [Colletotrichum phormii]KAK1622096.1 hypothetical protein BDP81DRAFT_455656 [Colletotrichum phormii]
MAAASYIRLHERSTHRHRNRQRPSTTLNTGQLDHRTCLYLRHHVLKDIKPATDLALSTKITALCDATTRAHLPSVVYDKGWKGVSRRDTPTVYSPTRKGLKPLLARQVEAHTTYRSGSQEPGTTNQIRHKAPKRYQEVFWACCLAATRRPREGGKSPAEMVRHVSDYIHRCLVPGCKHVGAGRADNSEHRRADGADLATPTSHVVPRFPPSRLEQGEGCWIVAENDLLHLRRFSLDQPDGS